MKLYAQLLKSKGAFISREYFCEKLAHHAKRYKQKEQIKNYVKVRDNKRKKI